MTTTAVQPDAPPPTAPGADPIRDRVAYVLNHYADPGRGALAANHPSVSALADIAQHLQASAELHRHPDVRVRWSAGTGRWADVPWVGMSVDETADRSPEPLAVDLLFRADMTGAYLVVMWKNAVDKFGAPKDATRALLGAVANGLSARGFLLDDGVDLRPRGAHVDTARKYQHAVFAYKLYERTTLPGDGALLEDLGAALDTYAAYRAAGDEAGARRVVERLLPDAPARAEVLRVLADSISTAHAAAPGSWQVTLHDDLVRLNVGKVLAVDLTAGYLTLTVDGSLLPPEVRASLDALPEPPSESGMVSVRDPLGVRLPAERVAELYPAIQSAHEALLHEAASKQRTSMWWRSHARSVVAYLRASGLNVEDPVYRVAGEPNGTDDTPPQPLPAPGARGVTGVTGVTASAIDRTALRSAFTERGLYYTDWQFACFITALQTKGFAVVSGISGTGKTKIVQHFAAMLPQPRAPRAAPDPRLVITAMPYMLQYRNVIVPKGVAAHLDVPAAGGSIHVRVSLGHVEGPCTLKHSVHSGSSTVIRLGLRGAVGKRFAEVVTAGDRFALVPGIDEAGPGQRLRILPESEWSATSEEAERNFLFLPVRPDWRDSKSLLGYFNPISETYEWTPFLRFLVRAARSYRDRDGIAWFVALDEMNLAHVEYYFADLLSVLESGRDDAGWTREALAISYPEDAEGDLPPREIRVPPNLYLVGTVNIDETTHAFSPKVLDRAFSMAFHDVDFAAYPAPSPGGAAPARADGVALLTAFTRGGRFVRIEKEAVAAFVARRPEVRTYMQSLNAALQQYGMHFGYRVFDEVVTFLDVAEANRLFADGAGKWPAFDAAILMKVLPKFHGSRAKLDRPLRALLAWCGNPGREPAGAGVASGPAAHETPVDCPLPRTAAYARKMLHDLTVDGFAAYA